MKFIAEDSTLTIRLEGVEILFGLRRQLVLPREQIADLHWEASFKDDGRLLRLGGVALPGLIYAGHFNELRTGEWVYLYLNRPRGFSVAGNLAADNVLVITLRGNRFRQVIVTCQPDIGAALTKWWGQPIP